MLIGLSLFWVGAVLFLNGLWVLDKVGDREIAVIDVFVGTLTLVVAIYLAFGPGRTPASIKGAAFLLLFTFTYYWVAWNRWNGADGRGLGWFCLFVAITCAPIAIQSFATAHTLWDYWLAFSWLSWGVLWFLFYLLLAAGQKGIDQIHRHAVHAWRVSIPGGFPAICCSSAPCPADRFRVIEAARARPWEPVWRIGGKREMPLYDYECGNCGPFRELAPMSEWEAEAAVPGLLATGAEARGGTDAGRALDEQPDRP